MRNRWQRIFLLAGVLLAAGGTFAWRDQTAADLRRQVRALQVQAEERTTLEEQNQELFRAQVSPDTLQGLLAAHVAAEKLRTEISDLEQRMRPVVDPGNWPPAAVPAAAWRNLGRRSPADAVETLLWAAVNGDIEVMAESLRLYESFRPLALELLDYLPAAMRREYDTPEKVIAMLTIMNIPVGEYRDLKVTQFSDSAATVTVTLCNPGGQVVSSPTLSLQRFGEEWKFVISDNLLHLQRSALESERRKLLRASPGIEFPGPRREMAW